MHGGAPAPWHERPIEDARRIHDHYVRTVPDRVARFGTLMEEAGFALEDLDWSSLDAFDDLWYWAHDHFSIFADRNARVQRGFIDPWVPYVPGCVLPPDWPSFNDQPDLTIEAQEFASGIAALLAQYAVEHWGARWVFGADLPLDESLQLRSILEIPRSADHAAANFGPVRVSPEQLIARTLRCHTPDPLWTGLPEWHRLHDRVGGPFKDWTQLFRDQAEEFHDLYVGGHIRRLSDFREWLLQRGLDTRAMAFDSIDDLDLIWAWSRANVEFPEQIRSPRTEWRTWYPTLAQGAEPDFELPRWDTVQLSAETLSFASGLAACATEVALRRWGADWHLGGRRGDLQAVNRTHLYVKGAHGRLESWVNIEHEIATWLADAVVRARRVPPRPAMWRRVIGETEMIAQFTALYEVAPAPWLAWRARFEPRLLPALPGAEPMAETIVADEVAETPTVQPLIPIPPEDDAAVAEAEPDAEPNAETEPVVEVEAEPVAVAEPEPVAEVETEPVAEVEAEPVAVAEPEPVAEVEAKPDAEPVAEVEAEPIAEPEPVEEVPSAPEVPEGAYAVPPMIWRTEMPNVEEWPEPSHDLPFVPEFHAPAAAAGRTFGAPPQPVGNDESLAENAPPVPEAVVAPPTDDVPEPALDTLPDEIEPEPVEATADTEVEAEPVPTEAAAETDSDVVDETEPVAANAADRAAEATSAETVAEVEQPTPVADPEPAAEAARSAVAARLAAAISLERAALSDFEAPDESESIETTEPANDVPTEPAEPAEPADQPVEQQPSADLGHPVVPPDGDLPELRIEPDDDAGERDWLIEIDAATSPLDPELVDRFARRLNRAKGVLSAQQTDPDRVQLRMNRFGHADLDSVEALVHRIWDQTKATHRGSVVAAAV